MVWPEPGSLFPPSVTRPMKSGETLKLAFGSCRISAPHEPPYTLNHAEDERGLGVDALYAAAMDLKDKPPEELPHALVLLEDQIYSHNPPSRLCDSSRSGAIRRILPVRPSRISRSTPGSTATPDRTQRFASCSRPFPRP